LGNLPVIYDVTGCYWSFKQAILPVKGKACHTLSELL